MGRKITRYATANLVNQLPEDLQRLLWAILDTFLSEMKGVDYLQVFELSIEIRSGKPMQNIQHRQEVPPLQRKIGLFQVTKPYKGTVWIYLDFEGHQTMMLLEDW